MSQKESLTNLKTCVQNLKVNRVAYDDPRVQLAEHLIVEGVTKAFGPFSSYAKTVEHYQIWKGDYNFGDEVTDKQAKFEAGIEDTLQLLDEMVADISDVEEAAEPPTSGKNRDSGTVFIVHGHDMVNALALQKMLKERWNISSIILRYEPGKGRTIIEKFEEEAARATFAFVIMTPDDQVKTSTGDYDQARPNVIFELGWFCGRLGRAQSCILFRRGMRIHSDLDGVERLEFNDSVEEVGLKVFDELKAARILPKSKVPHGQQRVIEKRRPAEPIPITPPASLLDLARIEKLLRDDEYLVREDGYRALQESYLGDKKNPALSLLRAKWNNQLGHADARD